MSGKAVSHGQPAAVNSGLGLSFLPTVALHLSFPMHGAFSSRKARHVKPGLSVSSQEAVAELTQVLSYRDKFYQPKPVFSKSPQNTQGTMDLLWGLENYLIWQHGCLVTHSPGPLSPQPYPCPLFQWPPPESH